MPATQTQTIAELGPPTRALPAIAVIGSFRQHYGMVLDAIDAFRKAGVDVKSPAGSAILKEGIEFVRFQSDDPALSDAAVQSVTLRNIFSADLVYVVAPGGYVGRTTCYEIGRLIQASRPVYLSDRPVDLPVNVPDRFITTPRELVRRLETGEALQRWWECEDELAALERELTVGHQR